MTYKKKLYKKSYKKDYKNSVIKKITDPSTCTFSKERNVCCLGHALKCAELKQGCGPGSCGRIRIPALCIF